jgi:hypothetical protein
MEPPKSKWYSQTGLNARGQAKVERVREYVAELEKIASSCEFTSDYFETEIL